MSRSRRPLRPASRLAAGLVALAAPACAEGGTPTTPAEEANLLDWSKQAALTAATSCEDAEALLEATAIAQMDMALAENKRCYLDESRCGYMRGPVMSEDAATGAPAPSAGGAAGNAADDARPDEYSETNTQVEGVDEADRVKTDGEHLYTLSGQDLVILKSWPASETDEVGRLRLRGQPSSLYLDGDRVVVIGQANLYDVSPDAPSQVVGGGTAVPGSTEPAEPPKEEAPEPLPADGGSSAGSAGSGEATPSSDEAGAEERPAADGGASADAAMPVDAPEGGEWRGYRNVTSVTVIDLGDRTNPSISKEFFVDGWAVDTRRIEDRVYLAQTTWMQFDNLVYWADGLDWGNRETDVAVVDAVYARIREENVARIREKTLDDWLPRVWTADGEADVAYASGVALSACTNVHVPTVFSGQGLLSLATIDVAAGSVDGSTIQGEWGNVYASTDALYIGSTNWGFYGWWQFDAERPPIKTAIHKFAYDAAGNARYTASGEVLGYAINQFAFDEHAGHLRVATTDGFGWWNNGETQTESRVTVLREAGDRLEQAGVVAGLGKGEQIFGVRFIGERGYVVTFRQVDPLYVIDLADPTAPSVAGELKIPGFSSYIHPLAPGYLLTAGRDGDADGRIGGVKVEIFDVRDSANPRSVKTAVIGDGWNTWSDVQWDHKAFTYFGARNLLALPVSGWVETQTPEGYWGEYKSELALFRVTTEEIEVLPGISHTSFFADYGANTQCRYYSGYWQASIYRGVFIEDYVYSLSQLGVQVHDTRDLAAGPVAAMTLLDPASFPVYDWEGCGGRPVAGGDGGEVPPADGGEGDGGEVPPADGGEVPPAEGSDPAAP
jgi:uncharacterized secreted protein with C-terminal beta-propeller domain